MNYFTEHIKEQTWKWRINGAVIIQQQEFEIGYNAAKILWYERKV
jgi:hypothetical protein